MIIALLSELARAESETIGLRVRSAKHAQRADGLWLSGNSPFGYAIAPNRRLVPVEPDASVMREDPLPAAHRCRAEPLRPGVMPGWHHGRL
jgi:DNA invertase Pin-like site-specific DNA recombinase